MKLMLGFTKELTGTLRDLFRKYMLEYTRGTDRFMALIILENDVRLYKII